MASTMSTEGSRKVSRKGSRKGGKNVSTMVKNSLLRVLLATGALLLVPFVAMRLTRAVAWDSHDFAVAAVLLAGAGLALEMALAMLRSRAARQIAGTAIVVALLTVWAELAVGIFH